VKTHLQIAVSSFSPEMAAASPTIAGLSGSDEEQLRSGNPYLVPVAPAERIPAAGAGASELGVPGWRGAAATSSFSPKRRTAAAPHRGERQTRAVKPLYQDAATLRASATYARGISIAADGKTTAAIRETFTSRRRS